MGLQAIDLSCFDDNLQQKHNQISCTAKKMLHIVDFEKVLRSTLNPDHENIYPTKNIYSQPKILGLSVASRLVNSYTL